MDDKLTRRRFGQLAAGAAVSVMTTTARSEPAQNDEKRWTYLDNGKLRLGFDRESGACIGSLAYSAKPAKNYLNHYDRGRFVQQSYYGDKDGSMWDKKPWMWNPVQGGDWRGKPARLVSFNANRTSFQSSSVAMHWATGEEITDVLFEQRVELQGELAHVRFKMTYKGSKSHAERHQEMPAVFVDRSLPNLAVYSGEKPWTQDALDITKPGWPNETRTLSEPWAAYLDENQSGIGVLIPTATRITCYRFGDGSHPSHCSYFAPIKTFAMTPGLVVEYDAYLSLGTVTELRSRFAKISNR